jgi:hypothetical protein
MEKNSMKEKKAKRPQGRPSNPDRLTVAVQIRMSQELKAQYLALGGAEWVRVAIDNAAKAL